MVFADRVRVQCRQNGSRPALSFGGVGPDTVSYESLGVYVDNVCSHFRRLGVVPGSIFGVLYRSPLMHAVLPLALERLGAVTVALKDASLSLALRQAQALKLAAVLTDRQLPACECPVLNIGEEWLESGAGSPESATLSYAWSPGDICRISFTSGSTGEPKPIGLTCAKMAANLVQQDIALGEIFRTSTRRLSCIGVDVRFGFALMMRTLAEGGLFCFPDWDMPRAARRIALYQVEILVGSPLQLAEYGAFSDRHPGSFPSLKMIVAGGSRTPRELAETLRHRMCPNVVCGYGSSETGIVAAALAEKLDLARGEVGYVIPEVEVEILDETTGRPLSEGTGRVRVKGKGVIRAYYGEAAGSGSHFDGEWFYPGDVGALSPAGILSIEAREDNVVNLGGVKTTLESLEALLRPAPAIANLAVIAAPDGLGISRVVAVIAPTAGWSEPAFWAYCQGNIDRRFWPARIALVDDIPQGPSGKIDRQRLPVTA